MRNVKKGEGKKRKEDELCGLAKNKEREEEEE